MKIFVNVVSGLPQRIKSTFLETLVIISTLGGLSITRSRSYCESIIWWIFQNNQMVQPNSYICQTISKRPDLPTYIVGNSMEKKNKKKYFWGCILFPTKLHFSYISFYSLWTIGGWWREAGGEGSSVVKKESLPYGTDGSGWWALCQHV